MLKIKLELRLNFVTLLGVLSFLLAVAGFIYTVAA